jgi:N utilization substance protein A
LLVYLLNKNVPEIAEGIVEIKKIARMPGGGFSKVAVSSTAEGINPVSTIFGPAGSRIKAVQAELNGERIDPVKYSDDLKTFIINICHPIKSRGVSIPQISGLSITDKLITIISDYKINNIVLISKLIGRPVDVITSEDAASIELEYEKVESYQQDRNNQHFNKNASFEKKEKVDLGMKKFEDLFND